MTAPRRLLAVSFAAVPVAIAGVALVDGQDALWALPVAVVALLVVLLLADQDLEIAAYAGALAGVFVSDAWSALGAVVLVGLLGVAQWVRSGLVFGLAAAGFVMPDAVGVWVVSGGVAMLVAWGGRMERAAVAMARWGLAGLMAFAAVFLLAPPWAVAVGFVAGVAARAVVAYPANVGAGRLAEGGAAAAVALPAAVVVVLASVDRMPALPDGGILLAAWGSVALGLTAYGFGVGMEALLRTAAPWRGPVLAAALATVLLGGLVALADGLQEAALALSVLWPLCVGPVAVGFVRIGRTVKVSAGYRITGLAGIAFLLTALRWFR